MRRISIFRTIVLLGAASAVSLCAQESPLERRVRILEAEARDRGVLEARVKELEGRLAGYESGATNADLAIEREVNSILTKRAAGMVEAAKSQRIAISGQLRMRFESRDPFDYRLPGTFGRPGSDTFGADDDRVEQRTRIRFDARATDHVRVFAELQDYRLWGSESSVLSNEKNVDLHQAYVDVEKLFGEELVLRAGRQELSYGDQRMVSPLDWSNIARAWDGFRWMYRPAEWQIDLFLTDVKDAAARTPSPGPTGDDQLFGGAYVSYRPAADHEYDAYFFHRSLHDGSVMSETSVAGDGEESWIGLRAKGKEGAFDWSAEGVYEFGDRAGDDIGAYAAALTAGYTFKDAASLRVGAEWTFATGDETSGDGDVDRFEAPYTFGHNYQGWADVFSWKNGHDFALHLSAKPGDDWTVGLSGHYFLLDEAQDGWFNSSGATLRRDPTGAAGDDVSAELDLYVKWQVRPQLMLFCGYSRFFAGSFVEDTGPSPDQDWVFFMLTADF